MNYEYIIRWVDTEGGKHRAVESRIYEHRLTAEMKADALRLEPKTKSVRIERRTVGRWEPLETAMKEVVG